MDRLIKKLLIDFDNLIRELTNLKYNSIAKILNALKQVFIKESK